MKLYYYGLQGLLGGIENYGRNLCLGLLKKPGMEVTLLPESESFAYKDELIEAGCQCHILPWWKRHPIRFYKELLKILRKADKDDIFQINVCSLRNPLVLLAAKKSGIKTIVVSHFSKLSGPTKILHQINRRRFRKLGIHVGVSQEAASFMFGNKDKSPIIIPNGIDDKKFAFSLENREKLREENDLVGKKVIGQIGRLSPEKNQQFSVEVLKKLNETGPLYTLVLVGEGHAEETIKQVVHEYGLDECVLFTGPVHEGIEKWYSVFDLLILPSKNDALSLVRLESSANGLMAIISDGVATLDVEPGPFARLPLEVDKWVDAINGYESFGDIASRKNGLEGTPYTLEGFIDSYMNLYKNYDEIKGAHR